MIKHMTVTDALAAADRLVADPSEAVREDALWNLAEAVRAELAPVPDTAELAAEAERAARTMAPPVPGVTRNAGYTVRAVIHMADAEPGSLAWWLVAAEDAGRDAWVTWNAYAQDGPRAGQLSYDAGHYFHTPDAARNRSAALRSLARRAGVKVIVPDPETLTPDMILAQRMAEQVYAIATCENHDIAWSRSPVYRHMDLAFRAAVQVAYSVTPLTAGRVRDLLSQYGPDDSLQGTTGHGVFSYVQAAKAWRTGW